LKDKAMTTRERIDQDYAREAKARNAAAVSTLRLLRAALKNAEIDKMKPLEEADVIDIISREVKKLADAIESYKAGNRGDLVGQAEAEMAFLKTYLPAQLDEAVLKELIAAKIAAVGATTIKDLGKVMSEVTKETKGRADGAKVSAMVKAALASGGT
jgi:uncharacterized protein